MTPTAAAGGGGNLMRPAVTPGVPTAPQTVTSITKDAGATVSFYAPGSAGSSGITSYTVTPYIAGVGQTPTTVAVGSLVSLTDSSGGTALQAAVTGLTNSTAYTFTVYATNSSGGGPESGASGANTPLAGLVFGDDFNGPAAGPLDPEWWVYNRCGYLGQSETEWYKPSHCVLDGAGNLALTATFAPVTGVSYPSNGNASVTQNWTSGACQSNAKSYAPSADGNTLTIETRFKTPSAIGDPYSTKGMWPGLLWTEGITYLTAWKTDPDQSGWNTTGKWELDVAEIGSSGQAGHGSATTFLYNISGGGGFLPSGGTGQALGFDASAGFHVYSATWKGTAAQANRAVNWYLDSPYVSGVGPSGGTHLGNNVTNDSSIATRSNPIFLLLYLQVLNTASSDPGIGAQTCSIDYVRIYDQNI